MAAVRTIAADGVDAVFNCVGGETFRRSFDAVRDGGRVVTIVACGEEVEPGRGITYQAFSARAQRRKLEKLSEMFDAGTLSPAAKAEITLTTISARDPRNRSRSSIGILID